MPRVDLSAGTIEYEDSGGSGPTVVFLSGVTISGSVWRHVVAELGTDYRCVVPTMPLGAHRIPMKPDADLSLRGLALLVAEFLDELDLRDVTLVLNDWGGAQLLVAEGRTDRIAKLALVACEAFDNFPPGIPGRALVLVSRIPGGLFVLGKSLMMKATRRAPMAWGWMSKRPVPHDVMDEWFGPIATQPEIRRDLRKYGRGAASKGQLLAYADALAEFDKPALVVWAPEDKLMPREHGRRLANLLPDARLVEIADSYTLIPEDQPGQLAHVLADFMAPDPRSRHRQAD